MKFFNLWNSCVFVFLVGTLVAPHAHALSEGEVYQQMVDVFQSGKKCNDSEVDFWQLRRVKAPRQVFSRPSVGFRASSMVETFLSGGREKILKSGDGEYLVRYSRFGCGIGQKGSLVIVPGRGEGSPDFYETAIDLVAMGYSPIYVTDPRGQGMSPRLLEGQQGHLVNFYHLLIDLDLTMKEVLEDLRKEGRQSKDPLFYASNSMGGGLGWGYFLYRSLLAEDSYARNPTPFTAAAMLGPMTRINYISFNGKAPHWWNRLLYSENGVLFQSSLACFLGAWLCDGYASPRFGDYDPRKRQFVANDPRTMTHSEARYRLRSFLTAGKAGGGFDWQGIRSEHYEPSENWNGLAVGGSTMNWVLATTSFLKDLKSKKSLRRLPNLPVMLLTGSHDLRVYRQYLDGFTDQSRQIRFCQRVNLYNQWGNTELCQFRAIAGAYHELWKESDEFRNAALEAMNQFFCRYHPSKCHSNLSAASAK